MHQKHQKKQSKYFCLHKKGRKLEVLRGGGIVCFAKKEARGEEKGTCSRRPFAPAHKKPNEAARGGGRLSFPQFCSGTFCAGSSWLGCRSVPLERLS